MASTVLYCLITRPAETLMVIAAAPLVIAGVVLAALVSAFLVFALIGFAFGRR